MGPGSERLLRGPGQPMVSAIGGGAGARQRHDVPGALPPPCPGGPVPTRFHTFVSRASGPTPPEQCAAASSVLRAASVSMRLQIRLSAVSISDAPSCSYMS